MTAHRWSGWPGAWCLDCGIEDQNEICIAEHSVILECVEGHVMCEEGHEMRRCDVHVNGPCPCPGEGHCDPYMRNEKRRELIYLLVRRLGDVLDTQQGCPQCYFGAPCTEHP